MVVNIQRLVLPNQVDGGGIEPPLSCISDRCATVTLAAGASGGIRTRDLSLTKTALYHQSFTSMADGLGFEPRS